MLLAYYIWRSLSHWINLFDYYQFSLWWEHLGNRFGAEWSLWRSSLKFELNLTPFKKRMIMSHNIFLVILWLSAHSAGRANTRNNMCLLFMIFSHPDPLFSRRDPGFELTCAGSWESEEEKSGCTSIIAFTQGFCFLWDRRGWINVKFSTWIIVASDFYMKNSSQWVVLWWWWWFYSNHIPFTLRMASSG